MRRIFYTVAFLVMVYASYFYVACEKTCDKIDGQRYDRQQQEWVPNDSTKNKE